MSNKQNNQNNQNNNNNKNNNGDDKNNFFEKNPILVFIIFSLVTIMAFKNLFPQDGMNVNAGQTAYGQSVNKSVAYSDIKKLITSGTIEYVGIGDTIIKAVSKPQGGQIVTYRARRVGTDQTLIPTLERMNIAYGGVNEQNILADMLFGWVLPLFFFFAIWMFLAKKCQNHLVAELVAYWVWVELKR